MLYYAVWYSISECSIVLVREQASRLRRLTLRATRASFQSLRFPRAGDALEPISADLAVLRLAGRCGKICFLDHRALQTMYNQRLLLIKIPGLAR